MRIIRNKAKCKRCGDVISSDTSDKYIHCTCGAIAVSGGYKAILRLGHHNDILELSEKEYE